MLDTPCILSCPRAALVSEGSFGGDEGTDGSKLAAGEGAGGAVTTGKKRLGMALADNRLTMCDSSLPSGRGESLRRPVDGRSRRSDTV
jgi:hypothetical protein